MPLHYKRNKWVFTLPVFLFFTFTTNKLRCQPKIVIPSFRCSTHRSDKDLYSLIKGCASLDSAYNRIVGYFSAANHDRFTLVCIQGCTPPLVIEFPQKKPVESHRVQGMGIAEAKPKGIPVYTFPGQGVERTFAMLLDPKLRGNKDIQRSVDPLQGISFGRNGDDWDYNLYSVRPGIDSGSNGYALCSIVAKTVDRQKFVVDVYNNFTGQSIWSSDIDLHHSVDVSTGNTTIVGLREKKSKEEALYEMSERTIEFLKHYTWDKDKITLNSLGTSGYTSLPYIEQYFSSRRDTQVVVVIQQQTRGPLPPSLETSFWHIQPVLKIDRANPLSWTVTAACSMECLLEMVRESEVSRMYEIIVAQNKIYLKPHVQK